MKNSFARDFPTRKLSNVWITFNFDIFTTSVASPDFRIMAFCLFPSSFVLRETKFRLSLLLAKICFFRFCLLKEKATGFESSGGICREKARSPFFFAAQ